jgi:hypothetical protein
MAGCPPVKGPTTSEVVNAFLECLSCLSGQATSLGGNAVIGVQAVMGDKLYVFVTGTAIWLDDPDYRGPPREQEEQRSPWPPNMWDFVRQWTKDL